MLLSRLKSGPSTPLRRKDSLIHPKSLCLTTMNGVTDGTAGTPAIPTCFALHSATGMTAPPHPTAMLQGSTTRTASHPIRDSPKSVEVLEGPSPCPPPLMLEGDEFYVSHDGVSRTLYHLEQYSSDLTASASSQKSLPMQVEEFYDLKGARKTFIMRRATNRRRNGKEPPKADVLGSNEAGVASLGTPENILELQEIDQGVFGSAGTGSTTWESSIVMSMLFSACPEILRGDVVELGSGVGLGGLLSQLATERSTNLRSLTLTDGNAEVLEQLEQNLRRATTGYPRYRRVPIDVAHIDWYEVVDPANATHVQQYDTVLASDCAYLYPDVVALSRALVTMCKPDGTIHAFGPYNRGALHDLVLQLRDKLHMNVVLDGIEMSRYRLKPVPGLRHATFPQSTRLHQFCRHEEECSFASRKSAKFLHITATHPSSLREGRGRRLSDID